MDVEFSKEQHGPVVTTVHMPDLEPVISDPDYDDSFLYQEDGYTYIFHYEHDSLDEDIKRAERGVRASVAWYLRLQREKGMQ